MNEAECCELDTSKCGGQATETQTCDTGFYWDDSKADTAIGADAKAACCTAVKTCAQVTCASGMKTKAGVGASNCTAEEMVSTKCQFAGTCCEKDTTKCGGADVTCPSGKTLDMTKGGTA